MSSDLSKIRRQKQRRRHQHFFLRKEYDHRERQNDDRREMLLYKLNCFHRYQPFFCIYGRNSKVAPLKFTANTHLHPVVFLQVGLQAHQKVDLVTHLKLFVDIGNVGAHGVNADVELLGDVLIFHAGR